ncbi:hypothetical protein E2C01_039174 [Portunus trituberculatus]|uniref:Uncharacterized protein n=1 Tax=Portunus trituberculatus TaxID=210409 RepID=A0A5B7FIY5_PORTR|nr:hypothetical protein [Portunus trituberculatus]
MKQVCCEAKEEYFNGAVIFCSAFVFFPLLPPSNVPPLRELTETVGISNTKPTVCLLSEVLD